MRLESNSDNYQTLWPIHCHVALQLWTAGQGVNLKSPFDGLVRKWESGKGCALGLDKNHRRPTSEASKGWKPSSLTWSSVCGPHERLTQ